MSTDPAPVDARPLPPDADRIVRRIDPLHAMIYFAPETTEELDALGISGRSQYFVQRAAALGAVGPGLVTATFYNFSPALVARATTGVWSVAAPADVLNARLRAADRALRRLLGDEVGGAAVGEAADLARRATEGATPEDRPLYAAHADLPWPEEPHLALWHAITLLREHRGDAHLHALLTAGLSGIEALVSHTATGRGFTVEFARSSRGWTEQEWSAAVAGLRERGLLDADGGLTDAGRALRDAVEEQTARTSRSPWRHLGVERTARLQEVAAPLVRTLSANGAFPDVFARPR